MQLESPQVLTPAPGSVGVVAPKRARFDQPLRLRSGAAIDGYELAYEAYGTLNEQRTNAVLVRKTLVANAVIATCAKALEAAGGAGYLRPSGIEKLLRDAYAAQFHPLQERKQQEFTGRLALGLDPFG